jgi:hypothetical protein
MVEHFVIYLECNCWTLSNMFGLESVEYMHVLEFDCICGGVTFGQIFVVVCNSHEKSVFSGSARDFLWWCITLKKMYSPMSAMQF